jgi:hypothetical protein
MPGTGSSGWRAQRRGVVGSAVLLMGGWPEIPEITVVLPLP